MTTLPIQGERPDLGEIPAEPVKRVGRPPGSKNQQNAVRDAERAQKRRIHEKKLARYEEQEAKRAPQFQIDQRGTLVLLVILGAVMFIATAVLTADGTIFSSAAARFGSPVLSFILFGAVEVAVLVFLLAYYMKGSRSREDGTPEVAVQWFVAMVFASTVAVALNVYHVLDVYEYDWSEPDLYVGVGIRVVVALFFVLVSKSLASVLFAKAVRL
jgi:hypothetical protein